LKVSAADSNQVRRKRQRLISNGPIESAGADHSIDSRHFPAGRLQIEFHRFPGSFRDNQP
jgi:hypothetical protein